jgi:hypothetical protein
MPRLAAFNPSLADPTKQPDMSAFIALREQHLSTFNEVFARHRLDAAIFPQMREQLAAREAKDIIHETTVSEINIAGLPGVTVPAGAYATGSPFNLIAIGRNGAKRTARHRNLLTNKRRATEKHRLSCAHDLSPEDAHRIDGGHNSTAGPQARLRLPRRCVGQPRARGSFLTQTGFSNDRLGSSLTGPFCAGWL